MKKGLMALQNGSDVRGVALPGVPGENVNLTPEAVEKIGQAFGKWLAAKVGKKTDELSVGIGNDSRLSAQTIKGALVKGLQSVGCEIFYSGLSSTPAMFMSTVVDGYKYDGSVMITASHLPFNRNGMKFFTCEGGLESTDIKAILEIAQGCEIDASAEVQNVTEIDFMSKYAEILVDTIRKEVNYTADYDKPLAGFKVIVDAGNGAGGFFESKVLKALGADTTGSQFLDPDGNFPNHIPNPENKEAMASIQKAVLDNKADLGIIFDTDVDRSAIVDRDGNAINSNSMIAMIAAIILEKYPNTTIVTDSITSTGLNKFIEKDLGGIHHRFKRGYKKVINESLRLNEEGQSSYLAMETSGHGAVKDNYFLDDGAYLAALVLIKLAKMKHESGKYVTELIEKLEHPEFSSEYRINITCEDFKGYGAKVLEDLEAFAADTASWSVVPKNYEGVKIDLFDGKGWVLARQSLHDPVIPINLELDDPADKDTVLEVLGGFLAQYESLSKL